MNWILDLKQWQSATARLVGLAVATVLFGLAWFFCIVSCVLVTTFGLGW
jgi:hypothetical protein